MFSDSEEVVAMKLRSISHNRKTSSQQGAILIFIAFLFPLILAFIGMGVDVSNLILAKLRTQTAIDNSIMHAPMLIIGTSLTDSQIADLLRERVKANMLTRVKTDFISEPDITVTPTQVSIGFRTRQKFYIMPGAFFGTAKSSQVAGYAKMIIPRVNLVVAVDCSKSMTLQDDMAGTGQTRYLTALGGLGQVGDWLREDFDRVALVTGNHVWDVGVDFRPLGSNPSYSATEILTVLATQTCDSWTNFGDAMEMARKPIVNAAPPITGDDLKLVVAFTDGHIQHGSFNITNGNNLPADDFGNHVYHAFISNMTAVGGVYRPAGASLRRFRLTGDAPWDDRRPPCDPSTASPPVVPPDISGCFSGGSINIQTPVGTISRPISSSSESQAQAVRELAHLEAITEAQASRNAGISVYVIGVGAPAKTTLEVPFGFGPDYNKFMYDYMRRVSLSPKPPTVTFPEVISHASEQGAHRNEVGDFFLAHSDVEPSEALRIALADLAFKMVK